MNLPNKLTMLRILMIPLFMVFIELEALPNHVLWAFVVFVLASLTDLLDGKIARTSLPILESLWTRLPTSCW